MEADQVIVEPQGDACHWPIDLAVAVQNLRTSYMICMYYGLGILVFEFLYSQYSTKSISSLVC